MTTSAEAVPAATILMLRPAATEFEVFMVVRHHQIDFASGALVFPGGKADEQDFDDALLAHLTGAHDDANMRAIQVCAIREAFEECGILLAYDNDGVMITGERLRELDSARKPLNDGSLSLLTFLQENGLSLACDQLVHFSHWITPEMMPKRFDTHFYLAVAPEDHLAIHDGYESVDSVWISPNQAIADAKDGKRTVIFPTLCNIEKLAAGSSVEDAIARAEADAIEPVLPWMESTEEGNFVCIPEGAGYPNTRERVPDRA